jgi:hypothetical protein
MSVSAVYLEATVNTAGVARHHGVEAFVNMSQMTVTQMSITETTESPQHKLHWLAEQALSWPGLPVVTVRPTVFLEGFFLLLAAASVRDADELALPMGAGKTSPVSSVDRWYAGKFGPDSIASPRVGSYIGRSPSTRAATCCSAAAHPAGGAFETTVATELSTRNTENFCHLSGDGFR